MDQLGGKISAAVDKIKELQKKNEELEQKNGELEQENNRYKEILESRLEHFDSTLGTVLDSEHLAKCTSIKAEEIAADRASSEEEAPSEEKPSSDSEPILHRYSPSY